MSKSLYLFLIDLDLVSALIPVLAILLTKGKTRLNLRRVLLYLSVVWLVAEFIVWLCNKNGINNILVIHIYDSLSTLGYLYFFSLAIPEKISKQLVWIIYVGYLLPIWGNIIYQGDFFEPSTLSSILTFAIPFLLSLYTFYVIALEARIVNLLQEPIYWINSALLIHFGFGLCANISFEIILDSDKLQVNIWPLVLISNIIHNIVFTIGIWKMSRISS